MRKLLNNKIKTPLLNLAGITVWLFSLCACQKSEDIKTSAVKPEKQLDSLLRFDLVHLYKDTVYTLSTVFTRESGQQLIIDEGTLIKINPGGTGNAIRIDPGGILVANGSSSAPIVFTSNTQESQQSDNWAGIIIRGKAINNARGPDGDSTDFSSSLRYVRIEFAALTLDAVGSRSVMENIMVSYSGTIGQLQASASFNFYGGSFNARNLISYACGGPADFYISYGYKGSLQNILAYRHPFFGGTGSDPANALAGLFIENNPSDPVNARPVTFPIISNLTVLGPNGQNGTSSSFRDSSLANGALVTTGNSSFAVRNSILLGFDNAAWEIGDAPTANTVKNGSSEFTHNIVQCADSNRSFLLNPGVYPPFTSQDFKNYMLQPPLENSLFITADDFLLTNPFNYGAPNPMPSDGSTLLTGANFTGNIFSNAFFTKVAYIGAFGKDNWMKDWTNFTPLKTNYNFPR